MTDTEKFFTILGRTKNLVLHATGDIYVRTNDRFVGRFPDILPARSKYQDEIETLRQNWHSFRPDDATTREPDTEYYLVKFQPTPRADTQIVGCLRFPHGTTYEQRQESLKRWQAIHRPHRPTLDPDETMHLDHVRVEDAP
jgi:hypothetical protein